MEYISAVVVGREVVEDGGEMAKIDAIDELVAVAIVVL